MSNRVISRSIFQISFRVEGPWKKQKIKEKCLWLFYKRNCIEALLFTKDCFLFFKIDVGSAVYKEASCFLLIISFLFL